MTDLDKRSMGFQISLNNDKPVRAGLDSRFYSITCIFTSAERKIKPENIIDLNISGLNSEKYQYVQWLNRDLTVGDKITIEVINGNFDPPARIERQETEEILLQSKLKAYHMLKEELKDHIKE